MSGTGVAYGTACLRACYAMSGTDIAYGTAGPMSTIDIDYATTGIILQPCSAVSSSRRYAATHSRRLQSSYHLSRYQQPYCPTRFLCRVRYHYRADIVWCYVRSGTDLAGTYNPYDIVMRSPVLTYGSVSMVLCASYAMSGTETG
eukprot:1420828-Rhodomonas_salina.3